MHPATRVFEWLPEMDFAVLAHGFVPHGRDYMVLIEDALGADPGQHELLFTHCVKAVYETSLGDAAWLSSWTDAFTNYESWEAAGHPEGYVWGTNWSLAYPGLRIVDPSAIAVEWSKRVKKPFYEVSLQTDRFLLSLVFHDIRQRKIGDVTSTVSQVLNPLPGP